MMTSLVSIIDLSKSLNTYCNNSGILMYSFIYNFIPKIIWYIFFAFFYAYAYTHTHIHMYSQQKQDTVYTILQFTFYLCDSFLY